MLLAAERQDVDAGRRLARPKSKPRAELAGREVVALIDEFSLVRRRLQPDIVEADVTRERKGCLRGRFDLNDGMQPREAIDEDDTREQWDLQDAEPNQPIGDVGRKVPPAPLGDGRRTDGS